MTENWGAIGNKTPALGQITKGAQNSMAGGKKKRMLSPLPMDALSPFEQTLSLSISILGWWEAFNKHKDIFDGLDAIIVNDLEI